MRICSSVVTMESHHELQRSQQEIRFNLPGNSKIGSPQFKTTIPNSPSKICQDKIELSARAKKALKDCEEKKNTLVKEILEDIEAKKGTVLSYILDRVLGIRVDKVHEIDLKDSEANFTFSFALNRQQIKEVSQRTANQQSFFSYQEKESLFFSATGMIETTDGKQIFFNTKLEMERKFTYEAVRTTDPLAINFAAKTPELTDNKYQFDLNADGKTEQMAFLKEGSGFLALDLNQDGEINNGQELFGPNSGDGFKDLAMFDEDQNGWIDEGDSIFGRLKIWTKDGSGLDQLFTLGEKGIGAIYLHSVAAPFNMASNAQTGAIARKSGLFLRENGSAGTAQLIDLVIR